MEALRQAEMEGQAGSGILEMQAGSAVQPDADESQAARAAALFQRDSVDALINLLLATGQRPRGGWHFATGHAAKEMDELSRSPALRRLRMALVDSEAVTPQLLHQLYRMKLLACVQEAEGATALSTVGKLVEKVPLDEKNGAGCAIDPLQQAENLKLLQQRLESSRELLGEITAGPGRSQAAAATQTDTPRAGVVPPADSAGQGWEPL